MFICHCSYSIWGSPAFWLILIVILGVREIVTGFQELEPHQEVSSEKCISPYPCSLFLFFASFLPFPICPLHVTNLFRFRFILSVHLLQKLHVYVFLNLSLLSYLKGSLLQIHLFTLLYLLKNIF